MEWRVSLTRWRKLRLPFHDHAIGKLVTPTGLEPVFSP